MPVSPSTQLKTSRRQPHPWPRLRPERPAPPPLDLGSAKAKQAVEKSIAALQARGLFDPDSGSELGPFTVTTDALGMTHVRLNHVHEGVPVLGEQVITHLNADDEVRSITESPSVLPAGLGSEALELDGEAALSIARRVFTHEEGRGVDGRTEEDGVSVERVIYRDAEGVFRNGYVATLANMNALQPLRMNYVIDAQTGEVASRWNQVGGLNLHDLEASAPVELKVSDIPRLAIPDETTVETKLTVTEDLRVDKLAVGLDITHPWRSDLTITLTSPAGTTVTLIDREGFDADDVKGDFDLSAFAGESSRGEWTLRVQDRARRNTGTLNAWGLNILGNRGGAPSPSPSPLERPVDTPARPVGDDLSTYSGTVHLETTRRADGRYELSDPTRGKGVVTRDALNQEFAYSTVAITDDNDIWGEPTDDPRNELAIDAHYGAQMTYDFFRDILGRDSIDGAGEVLQNNVHVGVKGANAFWDHERSSMNYGAGDGVQIGALTTTDIAGHEITHGLTARTAQLIYMHEMGGINESMSDIMGAGVEWYTSLRNPAVQFNWLCAEDAWTPGVERDALRYMNDPTLDGLSVDHYSRFTGDMDPHYSSGIMNNAFYLLAEGGMNRTSGQRVENGIGIEDALKIFGRALIHYMTPTTTFHKARAVTIEAATDLYGADAPQVATLAQAWSAVGVEDLAKVTAAHSEPASSGAR